MSQTRELPFSHVRRIEDLSSVGTAVRLSATEAERKAIAKAMGIMSVEACTGTRNVPMREESSTAWPLVRPRDARSSGCISR